MSINIPTMRPFSRHRYYHKIVDQSIVDGEQWYTIACAPAVANWIVQQTDKNYSWFTHPSTMKFDINESLYTIICLKWPNPA